MVYKMGQKIIKQKHRLFDLDNNNSLVGTENISQIVDLCYMPNYEKNESNNVELIS